MRTVLPVAAIALLALLLGGCGGSEDTRESLAGTPAAVHIVNDVEAMADACKKQTKKAREAGVKGFTNLAKLTSIHPQATFGPEEENELTMRRLLRRTVEKTGRCIGVSVDAEGKFHTTG
ncbi:MAG: hypothetical protein QM729_14370 [Solirubrobacterales bacterium]